MDATKIYNDRFNAFNIGVESYCRANVPAEKQAAFREAAYTAIENCGYEKTAIDWENLGNQAMDWAQSNPELTGAGLGALGGGAAGYFASEEENALRNAVLGALGGAGAGGLAGYGAGHYMNSQNQQWRDNIRDTFLAAEEYGPDKDNIQQAFDSRKFPGAVPNGAVRGIRDIVEMPESRAFMRPDISDLLEEVKKGMNHPGAYGESQRRLNDALNQ